MKTCKPCTVDIGSDMKIDYGFTVTGNRIVDVTLESAKIPWEELIQKDRRRPIIWQRQGCMYLIKKYTAMSLGAIGSPFCGRDHSTVMHAVKTIRNLYETNEEIKKFIDNVETTLKEKGYILSVLPFDRESGDKEYTKPLLSDDPDKWTHGELIIVKKLYEEYGSKEIADWLHRPHGQVKAKIKTMGIHKPVNRIQLQDRNVNYLKS